MAIFDITRTLTRSDGVFDRDRGKRLMAVTDWLTENVGEYYGSGSDRIVAVKVGSSGSEVIKIGKGWQIQKSWKGSPDGYAEVWWELDIDDEAMAAMFALKWL